MSVKTYNPKEVTVSFGGNVLTGYAEGTAVTVEYNEDAWTLQVGVDGEGTRSKSNNRSGRVTLSLMQSSLSNAILTAIAEADRLSNSGALPLLVKDNSSRGSQHMAETAWIVRVPSAEYAIEAGPREWVFETDTMVTVLDGN